MITAKLTGYVDEHGALHTTERVQPPPGTVEIIATSVAVERETRIDFRLTALT